MKVAEALALALKAEGVEYLICYPKNLLIDACTKVGIRPIVCRQERVGASIADGISRSTNGKKIGVFAMQGGPGIENAYPGVAQSFSDNVPVLFLPAGALGRTFTVPHYHPMEHFRGIIKWGATLDRAERVSELMRRAFHNLRSGKGGPIMLEIPNDMIDAELGVDWHYTPSRPVRSGPDPDDVKRVADILLAAKCPLLHAGQGVLYAGATPELVKLAELLQAPVITTNTGKSAFPEDHPLFAGATVISAPKAVFHYLKNADVIAGIGAGFVVNPWTPKIPAGKRLVQLTNEAADINKEQEVEAAILGDAKLSLQALIDEIGSRKRADYGVAAELAKLRREWQEEFRPELESTEVPINQYRIINELSKYMDHRTTILTHEAGSPREQLVPFWEAVTSRGYLGWGKSTQLGHGLGLIMGAKLANPDKHCINFMGDASIGMVGMDIETAVRSRIGILTIVFNNGVMAGERSSMPASIEKYGSSDLTGNYAGVASSLGAWSARITHPDEFLPALKQALDANAKGQPALIECVAKQNYRYSRY